MASGNHLATFLPLANEPPSSSYATLSARNAHPVLQFDAAADESAVWTSVVPGNYSGNGITATIYWSGASATSGNVVWNGSFERIDAGTLDIDADSFAAVQAATGAASGTSGVTTATTITFTNGAQMDSIAINETFRFKVTRDADNGSDTMTGDAEVLAVQLRET